MYSVICILGLRQKNDKHQVLFQTINHGRVLGLAGTNLIDVPPNIRYNNNMDFIGREGDRMEKVLKEILEKLNNLETTVIGIKDELGQMLKAIIESKEVQRGEIDTLTHLTAKIEGTIRELPSKS